MDSSAATPTSQFSWWDLRAQVQAFLPGVSVSIQTFSHCGNLIGWEISRLDLAIRFLYHGWVKGVSAAMRELHRVLPRRRLPS